MTDKLDLGDGDWAVLRDPKKVTERQRRPLLEVQEKVSGSDVADFFRERARLGDDVPDAEADRQLQPLFKQAARAGGFTSMREVSDHLIVALVQEWSFDFPVTVDNLLDVPGDQYDRLAEGCQPHLFPLLGITTDEDVENPDSSTEPAND